MIYFTSDQHFGHKNIITYCNRPFVSVEEMNEDMVERFNRTVGSADTVYHLGDFSLDPNITKRYVDRLNGQHFLVPGNHDTCHSTRSAHKVNSRKYREFGFVVLPEQFELFLPQVGHVLLCHMPLRHEDREDQRYQDHRPEDGNYTYLLHGHVHERWRRRGKMINVGVDQWDYSPVSLAQLCDYLAEYPHEG